MSPTLRTRLLVLGAAALLLRLGVLALVLLDPGVGLQVDEAQYWDWSRELHWGYYSKPPGIAALIAASTALGGDGIFGVRWLAMAVQVAACLALAPLAHDLALASWPQEPDRARRAALWAALIALTNPIAGLLGLAATTDAPLLLCWTLATHALWRLRRSGRLRDGLALGLGLGLGLLSKYTMAALLPGLLGWLWRRRHDGGPDPRAAIALAFALAALLLAPNLLWNAAAGWPTLHHTAEITVQASRDVQRPVLASLAEWIGGQWLMSGPLWLVLWLRWRPRLARDDAWPAPVRELLLAMTLPLLALGAAQALNAKAQINWTAPAVQGLVLALALWLSCAERRPLRRAAAIVVALHLLLVSTVPLIGTGVHLLGRAGAVPPRALDLWARMRGWEPALAALAPAARGPLAEGALLLGADRTLIAHGRHAWRDLPGADWHAWRPDASRPPTDHYQLVAGWPGPQGLQAADIGRTVLIVAEGSTPPSWTVTGPQARLAPLEPWVQTQAPQSGSPLQLTLWRSRILAPETSR